MHKIIFKKPDIKRLKEKGYNCVDMHIHSDYSLDSNNSVKDIIKKAKELGIGIAIADHNQIKGALDASKQNLFLIPAIEVATLEEFHLLFYFYTFPDLKKFYKMVILPNKRNIISGSSKLTALQLMDQAKRFNCIKVFAHPFRILSKTSFHPREKIRKRRIIQKNIDFIEVVNSKNSRWENKKSINLIKNKGIIGGSDAHNLYEIGTTVTCVKCRSVKAFLDTLKKRETIIIGKEVNFTNKLPIIMHYSKKVLKKFLNPKKR